MNYTKTRNKKSNSFSRANGPSKPPVSRRNSKKAASTLDPLKLIKKAETTEVEAYVPSRSFAEMPLHNKLKANIAARKFTHPTKIQDETLEYLISGRDIVGVANTGTGKTGAFLIPIIEQRLSRKEAFTSLIIVPTRELALQVEEEFRSLSAGLGIYSASFIGGTSVNKDINQLRKRNDFIIGTPGRLMDMANRGALRLQDISVLVLDEFDRMLDMGFVNDIKKIVRMMARRQQTMLFSATIDKTQKNLIAELLSNPIEVKVSSGTSTSDQVDQDIIRVPQGADKFDLLLGLLDDRDFNKVLIFAETKRQVDKINKKLNQSGVKADLIHGNKSQNYRNNALDRFKKGNVQVLVATDVAARGIDVSNVSHVINYQVPLNYDSYVHRIGRTGRAGKTGKAFTFVD